MKKLDYNHLTTGALTVDASHLIGVVNDLIDSHNNLLDKVEKLERDLMFATRGDIVLTEDVPEPTDGVKEFYQLAYDVQKAIRNPGYTITLHECEVQLIEKKRQIHIRPLKPTDDWPKDGKKKIIVDDNYIWPYAEVERILLWVQDGSYSMSEAEAKLRTLLEKRGK